MKKNFCKKIKRFKKRGIGAVCSEKIQGSQTKIEKKGDG